MSYKFNGGYGAVLCDGCNVIIDAGLSQRQYKDIYGTENTCWRCHAEVKKMMDENPIIDKPTAIQLVRKDHMKKREEECAAVFAKKK